jgi:hypothetical protein
MNRRRWTSIAALLLLLVVAAEVVVRIWKSPRGCVQIINGGTTAIEDLVVSYENTKVRVGRLAAGESTHVYFTAAKLGPLDLSFKQEGNPMAGFRIADYDPASNLRDGLKLVLEVKNNFVQRSVDDDETTKAHDALLERLKGWLAPDVKASR